VYAVKSIEEGIELLSGISAGTRDENGNFPEGSVFWRVDHKLTEYRRHMGPGEAEGTDIRKQKTKRLKEEDDDDEWLPQ
jgi:hypothetical protein